MRKEPGGKLKKALGSIWRFLVFLLSIALAVAGFCLVIYSWNELKIKDLDEVTFRQLQIVVLLILEYFLVVLTFICLAALIKKGFSNISYGGGVVSGFFGGFYIIFSMGVLSLFFGAIFYGPSSILAVFLLAFIIGALFGLVGFFEEIYRTSNQP